MAEFGQPAPVAGAQRFEKPAAAGGKAEAFPLAQLPQAQKQAVQAVSPKQPFGFAGLPQMMQNPWAGQGGFGGGFRGMLGAGMQNQVPFNMWDMRGKAQQAMQMQQAGANNWMLDPLGGGFGKWLADPLQMFDAPGRALRNALVGPAPQMQGQLGQWGNLGMRAVQ